MAYIIFSRLAVFFLHSDRWTMKAYLYHVTRIDLQCARPTYVFLSNTL